MGRFFWKNCHSTLSTRPQQGSACSVSGRERCPWQDVASPRRGKCLTPAHQRTAPGGLARHHKPIRSRHQQFVSLVCRGARDQEFLQDLQRTQHSASVQTQRAAAQDKVRKLEKALEIMSYVEGPAGRSKRRGGASIGRSGGAVRIFRIKIAATVGRAGQTTSGRGRTLEPGPGWDWRQSSVAQRLLRQMQTAS